MLGFVPVPKPVCGTELDDLDGVTHVCHRAAPFLAHIHRSSQVWFVGWTRIDWAYYLPFKTGRKADLAALTEARRALEWNDDPGQYEALNTAVIEAEKRVPFGRRRGWKYEARTSAKKTRCPECGKKRADITTDTDPYVQQLEGTDVLMTACGDCFERRTAES